MELNENQLQIQIQLYSSSQVAISTKHLPFSHPTHGIVSVLSSVRKRIRNFKPTDGYLGVTLVRNLAFNPTHASVRIRNRTPGPRKQQVEEWQIKFETLFNYISFKLIILLICVCCNFYFWSFNLFCFSTLHSVWFRVWVCVCL